MKCQKIQRIVVCTEESTWTAEIRTHVAECPECGRIHQQTAYTHDLVALKRYEMPGPDAEERCLNQVRANIERLRQLESESKPIPFMLPAPIYGIAAVCLILLGIHLAPSGTPSSLDTVVTDTGTRTFEQFLLEGPRSDWQPYFVTMPTDELPLPAVINRPLRPRPNSVFVTNSPRRSQ